MPSNESRMWDIVKGIGGLVLVFAGALVAASLMYGDLKADVQSNTGDIGCMKDVNKEWRAEMRARLIRIENHITGEHANETHAFNNPIGLDDPDFRLRLAEYDGARISEGQPNSEGD